MRSVPAVRFDRVSRVFDEVRAVDEVSLDIPDAEFFSMLGPSGSGKTTCLRLIAGFDLPTSGRIELHGVPAATLPPYERDVNTVFQDYALFPHMTVAENVGYGPMIRRLPGAERRARVAEALELVRLPGVGQRRPAELSGGQRQRVALARALINRPRVLLLDEPLGALDLRLRQQMQTELKAIQEQIGITFVYVTHDQDEALAMSDRLAIFNNGRIEQIGTPAEIYERPVTAFVADFVGASNLIDGDAALALTGSAEPFSIRPERIRLREAGRPPEPGGCSLDGRVREAIYLGMNTRYRVETDLGLLLTVVEPNGDTAPVDVHGARGRRVRLVWRAEHNHPLGARM
jgi:putative spermidine/putrescine transport system ATP-binding protein